MFRKKLLPAIIACAMVLTAMSFSASAAGASVTMNGKTYESLYAALSAITENETATITLGEGDYVLTNPSPDSNDGAFVVNDSKKITIVGAGKESTTIVTDHACAFQMQGEGSYLELKDLSLEATTHPIRLVNSDNLSFSATNVSFYAPSGVAFIYAKGCWNQSYSVYHDGLKISLNNVSYANTASPSAIYVQAFINAEISLDGCDISADNGRPIYYIYPAEGKTTISNSTIRGFTPISTNGSNMDITVNNRSTIHAYNTYTGAVNDTTAIQVHANGLNSSYPVVGNGYLGYGNTITVTDSTIVAETVKGEIAAIAAYTHDAKGNSTSLKNCVIQTSGTLTEDNGGDKLTPLYASSDATNQLVLENITYGETIVTGPLYMDMADLPEDTANESKLLNLIPEAKIGSTGYGSLQSAVSAAQAGDIITLLNDVTLSETLDIASDKKVTLDLAGHVISYNTTKAGTTQAVKNAGELTIMDSSEAGTGKITSLASNPDATEIPSYANNTIVNGGKLVVNGGTIECQTASGASYAIDTAYYDNNTAGPTTIINKGKIVAKGVAIRLIGYATEASNNLIVNGGEIQGSRAIWIHLPGATHEKRIVNVDINGGKLISTGESGGKYKFAIYSYSFGNNYDGVTVDISDAEVTGDIAVGGGSSEYEGTGAETLKIAGGTFRGDVYTYNSKTNNIDITGGTFSSNEGYYLAYVSKGYAAKDNGDGTSSVVLNQWLSATDAGYYMDGGTPYGMMRFLFSVIPGNNTTVTEVGIKYSKADDITSNSASKQGVSYKDAMNNFYGDITAIPFGKSDPVYAAAYIVTDDGKVIWSDPVSCRPNWNNNYSDYRPEVQD